MLQIKNICKQYVTGDLVQEALDDVSLNLRDNEFVAILGPSGSGKTTLLNIIGGLDRYDSGDLIINEISTKKYKDRDWDSYRNHTIGFVFQSYNLIPHQTVLANVELALTISGISRSERRKRAITALEQVGLGEQLHKKPNQMSGGQMQRVAIARALVNNPDILLADEPTGALDSDTSIQVMDLLKEVAKDRLVVMVTHNPELAEQYANRIVRLRDGKIIDDTNPYILEEKSLDAPKHANMGRAAMSFFTALSLSFNNLRTKKARTLLTAFAGSIGIIGIALILSLSNGVNQYITDIQRDTMASYPISIQAETIDLSSIMSAGREASQGGEAGHDLDGVYANNTDMELISTMTTSITKNNLTDFKSYLDDPDSEIHQYLGENGIVYSYDTQFDVYTYDPEEELINTDGSTFSDEAEETPAMMQRMNQMMGTENSYFDELLPGQGNALISTAVTEHYDLLYGSWPTAYNEIVLILDENNEIPSSVLYELGLLPASEYRQLQDQLEQGEEITLEEHSWTYEDICEKVYYLVPACDYYVENEEGLYAYVGDDEEALADLVENGVQLTITGIIRPSADSNALLMNGYVGYTKALTDYLIDYTNASAVVRAQIDSPEVNVVSGFQFEPEDDAAKIADTKEYLANLSISEKAALCQRMLRSMYADNPEQLEAMSSLGEAELAGMLDQYLASDTLDDESLLMIYDTYISPGSYDDNMTAFGWVSLDAPSSISIYADSFEDKDLIAGCIEDYNATASSENQIHYTDYVGLLMSSVTTIVDVISYVLIAFVSVSLIVSSIMIGIITYISVLERTKEIGILRAIGASKRNVAQVFNAETFIIGLCSGLLGVGITALLLIPINSIIHSLAGITTINASLPIVAAGFLVLLSMLLTMIAGLLPSGKAAKKDPVTALRTE
ncbi:MAG TPA: ABC transporter ATP-binding protein/permease [Candidatus Faecimorpha stercoravium]|nr:ABC transporter ATP-binding protein/permease [Candidatus Faecimorpha stercoravium]